MRTARLKLSVPTTYHVMSRIVDGVFRIKTPEKEFLVDLLWRAADFSGVEIYTYCALDSHFHVLVHIPDREELTEAEALRRVGVLYNDVKVLEYRQAWDRWREEGHEEVIQQDLDRLSARMYDVSEFVKTVKQRFSMWYNHKEGRRGTLWEDRFKSVIVGDGQFALQAMAAYIDLNPVRAGIVDDPKDYRWSGYGEAVAGKKRARKGLRSTFRQADADADWRTIAAHYRKQLFAIGEEHGVTPDGKPIRSGISRERIEKVLEEGGELSFGELLHCRVRYFSDGLVIGSKEFVNDVFKQRRDFFSPKRKNGARPMKLGEWGGLCAARDLRLAPVLPPGGG